MAALRKSSILFVCMGNICRSPTAEGVFRKRAEAAGLKGLVTVDSAGTHGYHVGDPPDRRSQDYAARRGYNLSKQRARQITASDFEKFDYLLAMDRDNLAILQAACPPQYQYRLHLFMHFAKKSDSEVVPDPYYGGGSGFDLVLDYIEDASDGLIEVLCKAKDFD
jgi:protein-tyrosine phosphatase